ncbi:DEKNAAC100344 [Brettanomyces naardenensis]|uniref:DEKNAAC100344 n=1 Tax=Brettanomyces naardenensis TaxID=13370 RepID=A0A448YGE3_BRENA|nr:DEKNAAC100344 [Brettanomyces naardenensis]
MERLAEWEADYLSERIRSSIDTLGSLADVIKDSLVECMLFPRLLRCNAELKKYFDRSFALMDVIDKSTFHPILRFYPGLIYCLFDGQEQQRAWAISKLPYHSNPAVTYTVQDFPPLVMEEYEIHLFQIQDPALYTDERAVKFWCSMDPILRFCDQESISQKLQYPITTDMYLDYVSFNVFPLTRVFINQSLSYLNTPLPFLLRTLAIFLERLGNTFFPLIKPHSYLTFFDIAFQNPAYLNWLTKLPQHINVSDQAQLDSSIEPLFHDMFRWMTSCFPLLKDSQKVQFSCIIFNFMLGKITDPNYGEFFSFFALNIMANQLRPENKLYDNKLTFELINDSKARALVDKRCIVVFDAIKNRSLSTPALNLVRSALEYDIALLAQYSHSLDLGDISVTPQSNPDLWNLLQNKITGTDPSVAAIVLGAFLNVVSVHSIDILYIKTKLENSSDFPNDRLKQLVSVCSKHNKNVIQWMSAVEKTLTRIVEYSSTKNKQDLVRNPAASKGIWSCILSPEQRIYQSGIFFLGDAFNVDGRYEAFKEALKFDISSVLKPLSVALKTFTKLEIFTPSKRGVRVLMDFSKALFDPIHGLLASRSSNLDMASREGLVEFWEAVWEFLRMIYKTIFTWSAVYERLKVNIQNKERAANISNDLLEFTRDTLDLSHSILNGYKLLVGAISFDGIAKDQLKDVKEGLFQPLLTALSDVVMWLRLSDPALLVLCVNLIVDILDLTMELGSKVSDDNVVVLTKLCSKAKKFNNKMNEEQTGEILLRARRVNSELVEQVFANVEEQKRSRLAIRQAGTTSSIGPGKPSPPKRLTLLEQARLRLSEKRKVASLLQPNREPAAARPAGFNKKKPTSESASESESESESEATALFTKEQVAAKLKKTKAALSSIQHHHPGYSMANKNAVMRESISKKKKAEELMRLRLNVNMNPFYQHVLSWSYEKSGEYPVDGDIGRFQTIRDSFESTEDYQKTFEPLLLLECWQGIQRAKDVGGEKPFRLTVASRSATDFFYDVYASVDRRLVTENRLFNDNDLIVLMYVENLPPSDKPMQRKQLQRRKASCFAKVREIKMSNGRYADLTLRVSTSTPMLSYLSPSTEIVGMRVTQMTTVEREYSSLKGLPYYDLCNSIIKAVPSEPERLNTAKVNELKRLYDVNESQAIAIAGTIHNDGFALIQGPPGTGKTKTILGIIGYFLTSAIPSSGTGQTIVVPESRNDPSTKNERRILICAPSNAAVDELVLRLRNGIKNSKGAMFKPHVVRLGRSDAINEQVRDITLEELVDAQLSSLQRVDDSAIREEHKKCVEERDRLRAELDSGKLSESEIAQAEIKLQDVVQRRRELGKKLDEAREQRSVSYRNREIERRNIQFKILNEAEVVCSTLSGSAHDILASMSLTFDTVVIDEAAQCTELSAIIPLRYGCTKCIMVGDPNQLPPTVLSQKAAAYKYEQSLFVRMQNNFKDSVYLLNVQYRMHPDISKFPSKEFYDSRLLDGPNMAEANARPWHEVRDYGPYRFFDVHGEEEQNQATKSLSNYVEASIALELVDDLLGKFPTVNWAGLIGIISPYKEQVRLLRRLFVDHFGNIITKQIDFNTVDGFQGQEKEVILFSCVRAENHTGIGFLADIRRMNVALTRARTSLWVLGSRKALVNNRTWKHLVDDAYKRDLVSQAYRGFTEDRQQRELKEVKAREEKFEHAMTTATAPTRVEASSKDIPEHSIGNGKRAINRRGDDGGERRPGGITFEEGRTDVGERINQVDDDKGGVGITAVDKRLLVRSGIEVDKRGADKINEEYENCKKATNMGPSRLHYEVDSPVTTSLMQKLERKNESPIPRTSGVLQPKTIEREAMGPVPQKSGIVPKQVGRVRETLSKAQQRLPESEFKNRKHLYDHKDSPSTRKRHRGARKSRSHSHESSNHPSTGLSSSGPPPSHGPKDGENDAEVFYPSRQYPGDRNFNSVPPTGEMHKLNKPRRNPAQHPRYNPHRK